MYHAKLTYSAWQAFLKLHYLYNPLKKQDIYEPAHYFLKDFSAIWATHETSSRWHVLLSIYKALVRGLLEPHVLASLKQRITNVNIYLSVLWASWLNILYCVIKLLNAKPSAAKNAHAYRPYAVFLTRNIISFRKPVDTSLIFFKGYAWISVYYNALRTLILPLIIAVACAGLLINFFTINCVRQLAVWAVIGLLFFWLISGFNFFLKRYRFGKFSSAIQRFWKRTNVYFWLIEGFLFSLFFYYYLNSSQEPLYMYDEANLNQLLTFSLTTTFYSYTLLVFLIFYSFYILLNLVNFNTRQLTAHLGLATVVLLYVYLLESYQFYYVITSFYENFWVFDNTQNTWVLEVETPRVRVKQQYLILALIAKYWHFLFIFLSWLFFFVKSFEQKRVSYTLFAVNVQNLLILFVLNILFAAQSIKWVFRRFLDSTYYWFFTDTNQWSAAFVVSELQALMSALFIHAFRFHIFFYFCFETTCKKIPIYD